MPKLTIDKREIDVPAGTKVIEAAERLGIVIPRFCYHPALGSVGACRVCAVAFTEGPVKGIQMSCMIEALDGMVVSTTDAEAVDFRRHVIEWLMLNHPHDCPVCDEGGHCLLQDLTVSGGHGMRRYQGLKRTHHNQDLGPLIQHEMNRCIQCYRCSRYYQEFSGYRDLGVMGIGSRVYFGRGRSGVLQSPFAGNLIDICPTGVYTDKPSRYSGRRWDFQRQPSVCLHCSLGCNLVVSARYRQVVRHEARPNDDVNGYFICDRGRYGYVYASAAERPRHAMAAGEPGSVEAVMGAARQAVEGTASRFGPESVALITSPRASLETLAMIKRASASHGWVGPAVVSTHRAARNLKAAVGCLKPHLAASLQEIAAADAVMVVGVDPLNEAPMLALALRQVQRRGGRVTVIDPRGIRLPFECDHWPVLPAELAGVLKALIQKVDTGTAPAPPSDGADAQRVAALAKRMNSSPRPAIVCGTDILTSAEIILAGDFAQALHRTHLEVKLFYAMAGANAFGAALAHDPVISCERILERIEDGSVRVLLAVEADLWTGFPDRRRLQEALKRLDHLVVLDYVDSPLNREAGYFIPTQSLYECGGHWINQEGRLQAASAVMAGGEPIAVTGGLDHPPRVFGASIPGGEPIAAGHALAALIEGTGAWEYEAADRVVKTALGAFHPAVRPMAASPARIDLDICAGSCMAGSAPAPVEGNVPTGGITLLLVDRTFGTETLAAMAPVLSQLEDPPAAGLHPDTLARLGLAEAGKVGISVNGHRLTVPVQADARMAPEVMVIPRHHRLEWQWLGETRLVIDSSKLIAHS